jgi:hypothetical protein
LCEVALYDVEVCVKAKWIDEVAGILDSEPFKAWLARLEDARKDLKVATERHEELLTQSNLLEFRAELLHRTAIDTLELANGLQDASAQLANEAAGLENESFEAVSQYEIQRTRTTDLWQRLGAIDTDLDHSPEASQKKKLQTLRAQVNVDYEREDARKQKLWAEVERLWIKNIDKSLELREKSHKAAIVHAEAERHFAKHAVEAEQASELKLKAEVVARAKQEKERALKEMQEQARDRFDCILHQDFLYWSAREDNKIVYATPVVHDHDNYGVEVNPGHLYRCPHDRGVESLERVKEVVAARAVEESDIAIKAAEAATHEPEGDAAAPRELPTKEDA